MSERRCLLTVHAHPDDEASKGPATVARYHAEGVYTVLVCCTGGEAGEILNPSFALAEGETLEQRRAHELVEAAKVIGYDEVVMLGYRDSGMPDSEANTHQEAFWNAPFDEAVGRLVAELRRVRPQVLIAYPDEQSEYPHPDHLRAHEVALAAFEAAGDPARFPEAGAPYQVAKLYYTVWPALRMSKLHDKHLELGVESPFDERFLERLSRGREEHFTTTISVEGFGQVRDEALKAHATQIDPASPFWFGLPEEVRQATHPFDHYNLARSHVGPLESEETDLFSGIVLDDESAGIRSRAQ
jgi:mycothiol S-conjugate amidase